jgi:hypothetical protein
MLHRDNKYQKKHNMGNRLSIQPIKDVRVWRIIDQLRKVGYHLESYGAFMALIDGKRKISIKINVKKN